MTATEPMAERPGLSAAKQALLAQRLRGSIPSATRAARSVTQRPEGSAIPLSYVQERIWFLEEFAPGTTAFTIPYVMRLSGALDVGQLRQAMQAVARRHEVLRMRYPATTDGLPRLELAPSDQAAIPLSVLTADATDRDPVSVARALLGETIGLPFDLARGPVVRAVLIALAPDDHVFAVLMHHIAADGTGADLLVHEIFAGYDALVDGRRPRSDPPAVDYGDFAGWQREQGVPRASLDYWVQRLADLPTLELPTDHPRPPERTASGAAHHFRLDPALSKAVARLADEQGATTYMVLLAALQATLGWYAGQDDFAVGSPVAGRPLPELEQMVGCFVNTIVLRAELTGDPTFGTLLRRCRDTVLGALSHQQVPFERLVQELNVPRDVAQTPLAQVMFAWQNYRTQAGGSRLSASLTAMPFDAQVYATKFDLELVATEGPDGIEAHFLYNPDIFVAATAELLARRLTAVLAAAVADPQSRLSGLPPLSPAERAVVVEQFNDTARAFPADKTLHALIAEQAQRSPDAVAVTFEARSLSYAELNQRANQVAHRLRELGVGPENLVPVVAERSLELVVALLAVLKTGAAYVPVDPGYPEQRVRAMIDDCDPAVILVQRRLRQALPSCTGQVLLLDDPQEWDGRALNDPDDVATADSIAYAIFTSGSTGRPKGVPNIHRAIVNRLTWMQRTYSLGPEDVVLQKTPSSFDVSVWEFFWPLLVGARVVLAAPEGHKDAGYLVELIRSEGVTTAHFVPSMLGLLLAQEQVSQCRSLRRIICSGEELPVALARQCLRALDVRLDNLYGPTEAAIDVSWWQCSPAALAGRSRVPIGRPIENVQLYVLSEDLRPLAIGAVGELHIGGVALARGYLGRPALTAERFVPNPFGPPGSRLYRTGDLARWNQDGTIDFLGRIDSQVKLRGLRIELGEIEAAIRDQPGVADAVTVLREDPPGGQRIVAYFTGNAQVADVRQALKGRLPDYMVPSAFVVLAELPLSLNGKLDRRALPQPHAERDAGVAFTAPSTASELLLAELWCDVLKQPKVGVDDDFFDLGGHSMLVAQLVARLRAAIGAGISVMDFFKHPTIRRLAALIDLPAADRAPREVLHELTRPKPGITTTVTYVCVPYGGGSAVVYQPLADALPDGARLLSIAFPGHDLGVDEQPVPFDELVRRCLGEIELKVSGPIVVYGHCGVGSALAIEIARRLDAAGRTPTAVFIGAIFPFAKPKGALLNVVARVQRRLEHLSSDQNYLNWLTSVGVDFGELPRAEARHYVQRMRVDSQQAFDYYTDLLHRQVDRIKAPVISIAGTKDPATDFYQERYREWHFLTDTTAVVAVDEGGHYFLKHRPDELAEILTLTPTALAASQTPAALDASQALSAPDGSQALSKANRGHDAGWWLHETSHSSTPRVARGPAPSMSRFLTVAGSQLVSMTGSALTEFALPLWIYLHTGSLVRFGLLAAIGLVPGMLIAPVAGAMVDRYSRRLVMALGDCGAGLAELVLGVLLWTHHFELWAVYPILAAVSIALTFQRLAYGSAMAQLVPKQYLGNANGVVQMFGGVAQVLTPLIAVGLVATIGLGGIVALDIASYAFAIAVLAAVRFPATMAWTRREALRAEIVNGFRYSWQQPSFRAMLLFFAVLNIFLAPLFLLISPLVLSFATLHDVALVAIAAGLGGTIGGFTMAWWGGPPKQRMRAVLLWTLAMSGTCLITGLHATLGVVIVGVFGMSFTLTLVNGIYTTIVQVKVPQRFHGRVFSLNTLIAWSTLPLAWIVVAPAAPRLLNPLLQQDGALAPSVGRLLGVGPGRGIGLLYVLFAIGMAILVWVSLRTRLLAGFDQEVPDAVADDLIGQEIIQARQARK